MRPMRLFRSEYLIDKAGLAHYLIKKQAEFDLDREPFEPCCHY